MMRLILPYAPLFALFIIKRPNVTRRHLPLIARWPFFIVHGSQPKKLMSRKLAQKFQAIAISSHTQNECCEQA